MSQMFSPHGEENRLESSRSLPSPSQLPDGALPENIAAPTSSKSSPIDLRALGVQSWRKKSLAPVVDLSQETIKREAADLLKTVESSEERRLIRVNKELSYAEFLQEVLQNPRLLIRNAAQYTADAMEAFGFTEKVVLGKPILDFHLRHWPWQSDRLHNHIRLEGQELALYEFYLQMRVFSRKDHCNRMFVFHGPPGSGKTFLNETIDAMLENYSEEHQEGALYRLIWVFPENTGGKFGFHVRPKPGEEVEELHTGDRIIYRPKAHTDPLFLLSNSSSESGSREQLLKVMERLGLPSSEINIPYLLGGELDSFSEQIVETALAYYREENLRISSSASPGELFGELLKNHVRVERFTLSRKQGRALCSIRPTPDRNADMEPFYHFQAAPPPQIYAAERDLFSVTSLMLGANRGHLHYSDVFRLDERDKSEEDISRLSHLLDEIEGGSTQIYSLRQAASLRTEKVNLIFRADANDEHIDSKRGGSSWGSFRRRLNFISVPHITRYLSEADAHRGFLKAIAGPERVICPHFLETFALFVTATRLLKPQPSRYEGGKIQTHEKLPAILGRMSVVEKALLLQEPRDGVKNEMNMLKSKESQRWSQQDLQILKTFLPVIADEYMKGVGETRFGFYDGGFGISTGAAQDLLKEIVLFKSNEPLSVIEVIQRLSEQRESGFEYYAQYERAKEAAVQDEVQRRLREERASGKNPSQEQINGLVKQIQEALEKSYPLANPDSLIREVRSFAQRRIQDDIYLALGISSEEEGALSLRRYIAHARASAGTDSEEVPLEYRLTSDEVGANERLLEDFENKVMKDRDFSNTTKRRAFRKELLQQMGSWARRHPGDSIDGNLENIFEDLMERIRNVQKEILQKPLRDFIEATKDYSESPDRLQKDLSGDSEIKKRALRWKRTVEYLETKLGYPKEEKKHTIRKHVDWALKSFS